MATIIICTNFSPASRNALAYISGLVAEKGRLEKLEFVLLHLFELPVSYAGEGIALTTIPSEISLAEEQLNQEYNWIKNLYPGLDIKPRMVTGTLTIGLEEQIEELSPSLVIMGAGGRYSDLLSWDQEVLTLFRELTVPVFVIPKHITYTKLDNIAYSCNVNNVARIPFNLIKGLVQYTHAKIHVLLVRTPGGEKNTATRKNEQFVMENLDEVNAEYHIVSEKSLVEEVSHFVNENNIDLLLVTPR